MQEILPREAARSEKVRRGNIRRSCRRLQGVIDENYTDGCQVITLTFGDDGKGRRRRKYAEADVRSWFRTVRSELGAFRYIVSEEPDGSGGMAACRVIVGAEMEAACAGKVWEHGKVEVERVGLAEMEGLAERVMGAWISAGHNIEPCRRAWSVARGMGRG